VRDEPDKSWGDVEAGIRNAAVRVSQTYSTAMEHHNPMEPHATVAHWEGDRLTVYDATQYVSGVRDTLAKTLGIPAEKIHVVNPYVGGGFGCKGSAWSHVTLAALAAQGARRPVKLVLARWQMFGPSAGDRAPSSACCSRRSATASSPRSVTTSSRIRSFMEDYAEAATAPTKALYACANAALTQRLVQLNVGVPTFQRAPGEATGTFALESAMDELAYGARHGSAGAAAAQPRGDRAVERQAVVEQAAAAVLRDRRAQVRLVAQEPQAGIDARLAASSSDTGWRRRRIRRIASRRQLRRGCCVTGRCSCSRERRTWARGRTRS
jgi:hypothetical protein